MNFSEFFKASPDKGNNRNVMLICWMNFHWGVATSMMLTLLPVFIVDELGGSSKSFGTLEAGVIFLSFMARLFAGFLIDIFKKKIPMLLTGTVLTIFSKIALACSFNILFVFFAKAIDRFAKGLRQAPTDTILAELSASKGFAYSLRYMMNMAGALIGSCITSLIVYNFGKNFRLVFSLAIIPTLIALYILKTKIKYNDNKENKITDKQKWNTKSISLMPKEYWRYIIIIAILMFARFNEGFITLRAKEVLPEWIASFPMFMAMYEVLAVLIAIPIGRLSDKIDKRIILLCGIFVLLVTDIIGLFAHNFFTIIMIYLGAGIHMGATQGIIASVIAKSSPKHLIGTAFAIFYGIDAIALACANYIAGSSSKTALFLGLQASAGPFILGTIASSTAIFYIIYLMRKKN